MVKNIYKLHVVERGQGPPVILLHGGLSTHRNWTEVAASLDDKRRLLMPDLLGFGGSPKPRRADYSMAQMLACLEHTFDEYTFKQPPVLAGHSLGANIALRWALERPDSFAGLVLSAPLLFNQSEFYQQMATIPLEGRWLANKTLARLVTFALSLSGLVPTRLAAHFAGGRPRYVMEDVTNQRFFVFRKLLKHTYFRDDVLTELHQLKLPSYILIGDEDRLANHALVELETLCKKNAFCQLQVFPGSHQILLEHPQEVAKLILSV